MTYTDIKPYLKPEFVAGQSEEYLTTLTNGVWDYVVNYCNWDTTKDPPPGLIMVCADMVMFYANLKPEFEEMKNDDMGLVFTTDLPDTLTTRLTVYRRLRW